MIKNALHLLKLLVNLNKIPINQTDKSKNTLLHYACRNRNLNILKYLIKLDEIDLNARNENDETLLHITCANVYLTKARHILFHLVKSM